MRRPTYLILVFLFVTISVTGITQYAHAKIAPPQITLPSATQSVNPELTTLHATLANPKAPTDTNKSIGFSSNGIYGCSGAPYGSVGIQGPQNAFVPVFDSASFDQQRILTYKECILDSIASSVEKNLIAQMVKNFITTLNTGQNGNPVFITNLEEHNKNKVVIPTTKEFITGAATDAIAPSFKNEVRNALSTYAAAKINTPYKVPGCSLTSQQLEAFKRGDFNGGGGWSAFLTRGTMPGCDELKTYFIAQNNYDKLIAYKLKLDATQLSWNNGFLSKVKKETINVGGGRTITRNRVVTPGYLIAKQASLVLGTGVRQAENVNQIDQMVSGLMLNIGTQMVSGINGFSGLSSSPANGIGSYLSRLVEQTARQARDKMVGAATTILNNSIVFEQEYNKARKASALVLASGGTQLSSWENICRVGLLDAAKAAMKKKVEEQVCPGLTKDEVCKVSITVTQKTATNVIIVTAPTATSTIPVSSSIVISGKVSRSGSSIDITISEGDKSLSPVKPTVAEDGKWITDATSLASLPDGKIIVSATETLANGAGILAPISATITKETTKKGIILTLPIKRPNVTITAKASGALESITLNINASHSNDVITPNITPLLAAVELDIYRSNNALLLLKRMRTELGATTSTRGKQIILKQLDELVAKGLVHTKSDARASSVQFSSIKTATQQKLESTRKEWQAGWCSPDNWSQYVLK